MPLYHIQDHERPMWVVARDYASAVTRWRQHVANEAEIPEDQVDEPEGYTRVCDDGEFIESSLALLCLAVKCIRDWHGMGMRAFAADRAWSIYWNSSPEMKPFREVFGGDPTSTRQKAPEDGMPVEGGQTHCKGDPSA